ncbi:MAG: hypothetical protein OSB70_14480 [Myxococcota bacterium]|nr:hypothetical protein [Myxococcota bacterium]
MADLRGERIYYVPSPGNGGDGLIAEATYQLFDRLELDCQIWRGDEYDIEKSVIIYAGGGILVPFYTDASNFFARHHARAKRLVLLPHTVDGHEELLGQLGPNVDIFCREHRSYEHVTRFAPGASVYMGEDMAPSLDLKKLLGDSPMPPHEPLEN